MPSLRLCSHIKTNGIKCGSPALRHHTLCYFHYQWQRRDQRRVRLGGPIGMNKNTGIELPLLDGPEAILVSIMEIQNAIVDQRIGEQAPPKLPPSRVHARRQIVPSEEKQTVPSTSSGQALRLRDSRRSAQDDTSKTHAISYADFILGSIPNPLIDLPGKFPQLAETKRAET